MKKRNKKIKKPLTINGIFYFVVHNILFKNIRFITYPIINSGTHWFLIKIRDRIKNEKNKRFLITGLQKENNTIKK